MDFQEAVEYIANRFNLPLRYEENAHQGTSHNQVSEKKKLLDAHELASSWYRRRFLDETPEGEFIRDYWTMERGFSLELAEEFGIGFAPPDCSALVNVFADTDLAPEVLEKTGLFFERRRKSNLMPRFRGRLMIPIRDTQGRIVAFTARQLSVTPENDPTREAKYVNSPETPIFSKSNILFNLDKARPNIRENDRFLLVEGQLDAIRCWEQGVKTVVAPQGTAFTEGQAYLMRRYDPAGVDCLLDGDEAGRKAALRMLPIFIKTSIEPRFLMLNPGEDPDELLRTEGLAALEKLSEQALGAIEFATSMHLGDTKNPTPIQKNKVLEHIFAIIAETDSLVAQDEYLSQAVNLLKLKENSTRHELDRYLRRRKPGKKFKVRDSSSSNESSENGSRKLTTIEDDLLLLLLHHDEVAGPLAQVVEPEWLDLQKVSGRVLVKALAEIREDTWNGANSLDDLLEHDDERNTVYSILSQISIHQAFESAVQACNTCLQAVFIRHIKRREDQIRERFANLSSEGSKELTALRKELNTIRSSRKLPPTLNLSSSHSPKSHPAYDNDQIQKTTGVSQNEKENCNQGLSKQEAYEEAKACKEKNRCVESRNKSKGRDHKEGIRLNEEDKDARQEEDLF